jgi:hypothetical protein
MIIDESVREIVEKEPNFDFWIRNCFFCEIRRNPTLGHYCGYVWIPEGHRFFNKKTEDIKVEVHGGLTYCGHNDAHKYYVIGFDCGHYGDFSNFLYPNEQMAETMKNFRPLKIEQYRTYEYVKSEVERLSDQCKNATTDRLIKKKSKNIQEVFEKLLLSFES